MQTLMSRMRFPAHASHRGGRGKYAPENTMYAYRKAVHECSTDVLEIDLHLSKDGHIVLCHDSSIDTTSNGHGLIKDMTVEQLRNYDAAHNYTADGSTFPLRGQKITFPTLQEVLDEFLSVEKLSFFLDVKCAEVVDPMFKVIADRKIESRVILGALDPSVNKLLLSKKPAQIPLTIDVESMRGVCILKYYFGKLASHNIQHEIVGFYADESAKHTLIPDLFDALHKKQKTIAVFGEMVNHEQGQKALIDLKSDILFSDRPDILRKTIS